MKLINDLRAHNLAIQQELGNAFSRVLERGWFALGPEVEAFEQAFAEYCDNTYCIGVASGSDALELALRCLAITPGDEVIQAANAGGYGTIATQRVGAKPVYADVDRSTQLVTAATLEPCLGPRTRAIIVTHLFGLHADMDDILSLAEKHELKVLEDCAQAVGARANSIHAGSRGTMAAFSFYPTKNLGALGDGGAVVTSDTALAEKCRALRQYGWTSKYRIEIPGGQNSRLDELQAAFLSAKLPHVDAWNKQRIQIAHCYEEHLQNPAITKPPFYDDGSHVYHLYVVQTNGRDALRGYLRERGIGTDIHYPVLDCDQSANEPGGQSFALPTTRDLNKHLLTLPCYPELPIRAAVKIAEDINNWDPTTETQQA